MDDMGLFAKVSSLEELCIKVANLEVLLSSIKVAPDSVTVYPVRCPAVGRSEDYLKDNENKAACSFGKSMCKYLVNAEFRLDTYAKFIECKFSK